MQIVKEASVTENRHLYIGGSDVSTIMNLVKFEDDRFGLLKQKVEPALRTFEGNKYTEYGDILEPKIRDYINEMNRKYDGAKVDFVPDVRIVDRYRGNCDGFNGTEILEIKTTSQIHDRVEEYDYYVVQMLFYMHIFEVERGWLAVYERPEDFNTDFDSNRLHLYEVNKSDFEELNAEMFKQIELFLKDLDWLRERVDENPLLTRMEVLEQITESELPSRVNLVPIANSVVELEIALTQYKAMENELKEKKKELTRLFDKYSIKSWRLPNGTLLTRVADVPDKEETVLDIDKMKEENPELVNRYYITKTKRGKKNGVRVTLPKEKSL